MVEGNPKADLKLANDRSLKSLERAIALSGGQFSLCLVCCNYKVLQAQVLQKLQFIFVGAEQILIFVLPRNVISLYTTIHSQLMSAQPLALMVLGLESVEKIDDLLTSINQVRDEFRKRHPWTLVLWMNDEVLQKLVRLAPDFASWAATPIRFELTSQELLQFLSQETNSVFTSVLQKNTEQWQHNDELHFAIKDLQNRGIKLEPELNASLEFVFGLDDYASDRIDSALVHFQHSLQYWQPDHLLRSGILLYYIGLCYYRLAERNNTDNHRYLPSAKSYLQQSLQSFELAERADIVAEFIGQLSEVLQQLSEWKQLQTVAQKSLDLHQTYGTHIQQACDYGFLADVALVEHNWSQAKNFAQTSLFHLAEVRKNREQHQGLFPLLLEQTYQLVYTQALRQLGEEKKAILRLKTACGKLDQALEGSDHRYNAHRYLRLLRRLRSLYFDLGQYLEAFCIRQKRRSVEQQYGFRAFIGAGRLQPQRQANNPVLASPVLGSSVALEITASGRQRDINQLIGRISRSDQKLTVIHGQSGVGKSSTVTAGLVPALQNRAIGDQIAVPVVLQVYTDWVRELGKSLKQAQLQIQSNVRATVLNTSFYSATLNVVPGILAQLQENAHNHLITVLIFDQLEEFFFSCTSQQVLEQFDQFICDCLNISFVKVIFSLREDYLHRLLEFKHLAAQEQINHNILDKNIRYQLNNFSREDAKTIIQKLTERSHVILEPALIDALVQDLSAELGEVRPIELQVVGVQLQEETITSLTKYEPFRPNKLIERYIKELIKECGSENNQRVALLVLYLLTDERNKRPFKTRAELAAELAELEDIEKLELILEILVRSGLVVLFPDVPERYQLIHDYLVDLIRYLQQAELNLQTQLKDLRNQIEQREAEISRLNSELRKNKQQSKLVDSPPPQGVNLLTDLKELRKREEISRVEIERLVVEVEQQKLQAELAESREKQKLSEARVNRVLITLSSLTAIFILTASTLITAYLWRQAVINEIQAVSTSSQTLFSSGQDVEALRQALKAARTLQTAILPDANTRAQVMTALYQVVPKVRERGSIKGHLAGVNSVAWSPNSGNLVRGGLIVTASADKTIKLWGRDGSLDKTLKGHTDVVNSATFSPDGQAIASASQDKTVKLWSLDGRNIKTLTGHTNVVNHVNYSPDGQIIASASTDKTIKLWSRDGKLLKTLLGHKDAVLGVAWSPDGSTIVSASTDKTIKLWSRDGQLLKTLTGHNDAVKSVAWSLDGKIIASASLDKTIKLWSQDGRLLRTLQGHSEAVTSVTFSLDRQIIASTSTDDTVKLWQIDDGKLLGTWKGHSNWINSGSFSPDGKIFASASRDKTVKLWNWQDVCLGNLKAHSETVTGVSFSPKGDLFASASSDHTVKIWNRDGRFLKTLLGHQDEVWGVTFSPGGSMLASASKDKTVKLWSRNGKLLNTLLGHSNVVLSVAWSPDGSTIASASRDKTVKLWTRQGKLLKTLFGHTDVVNWVSFSPDGKLLASSSDDNTVRLWSQDGKLLHILEGHNRPVFGVAWFPDGSQIASTSLDGTVKIWNLEGSLLRIIASGDKLIGVALSPDGKTIAATSDEKVSLWNQKGDLLMTIKKNKDEFTSISFSPDGKTLVSGTASGTVILRNWEDITLEKLLASGEDSLHSLDV